MNRSRNEIRRPLLALLLVLLAAGALGAGRAGAAPAGAYELASLVSIPEAPGHLLGLARDPAAPDSTRYVASADGGRSWRQIPLPPSPGGPALGMGTRGAGQQPRWVAAYGQFSPAAFYRSGDAGATWAAAALTGPSAGLRMHVTGLHVSPASSTHLYAIQFLYDRVPCGEFDYCDVPVWQLFASEDAGVSWIGKTALTEPQAITPSPVLARRIYRKIGASWWQSDNAGDSWAARAFPIATLTPDGENADWLYSRDGGGQRSADGGAAWRAWAARPCAQPDDLTAHPAIAGLLFARCGATLHRSRTGGDSWQLLAPGAAGWLHADLGHPSRLLLVAGPRLLESLDEGATWRPVANRLTIFRSFAPALLGR